MDFYYTAYKWHMTPRELSMRCTGLEYELMRAALMKIVQIENSKGGDSQNHR